MNRLNGFLVFRVIEKHIKRREPMSLIRLGDGEGAIMGYPKFTSLHNAQGIGSVWFGQKELTSDECESLSIQLRASVKNADIVGLPRAKQVSANPLYKAVEKSIQHFDLLSGKTIVTDAAIHRYLQFALLYRPLLANSAFVGLISSRDLRMPLQQLFNIEHVELYQIKGEQRFPGDVQKEHYPEHFEWLKANIRVPFQGAIFLIGAGGLGKIYCDAIKQKGGIAIDIGAMFDAWAKVKSRLTHPSHSIDRYSDMPQISLNNAVVRYNKLVRLLKLDTSMARAENMKGSLQNW